MPRTLDARGVSDFETIVSCTERVTLAVMRDPSESARDPFVGRELELDELALQLNRALRGRPKFVFLSGEAGVGKTRLLREFSAMARRLGMQVIYGRAMEDSSTPYLAFLHVLEACARSTPHHTSHKADPFTLLSAPGSLEQPNAQTHRPARASDVGYDRLRLFVTIVRQIMDLSRREPLLLVLDDLHWADAPTLDLLAQLVFVVADAAAADERLSLITIAAHRPLAAAHRLSKLRERLRRESIVSSLALEGLSERETSLLLAELGVPRAAHQLVDAVQRVTHGSPLFVREMLHHLERHDLLDRGRSYTTVKALPAHLELPDDVRGALADRLAALSEQDIELLTLAALVGDGVALERIARVCDRDLDAALATLERGVAAELVQLEGQTFRFRHPLIRELLAARASPLRRQVLHQRVARSLETERPARDGNEGARSLELARHLLASGERASERLRYHAERGAQHASSLFAWSEAAGLFATAATAAEALGDASPRELGQLHLQSGLAHQHDFDFGPSTYHYDRAATYFAAAADLIGQAQTLRHRTRALVLSSAISYGQSLDLREHDQVLARLGEREPLVRAALLEAMSQAFWTARNTLRAEALARSALALAEQVGDARVCTQSLHCLGLALFQGGKLTEAFDAYRRGFESAQRAGDVWLQIPSLQRLCALHICFGELERAAQLCNDARALTAQAYHSAEAAFVQGNRASIALARADLASVQEHAREAVHLAKRARYPWGGLIALTTLTWARTQAERYEDAVYAIEQLAVPGEFFDEPGAAVLFTVALWKSFIELCADPAARTPAMRERFAQFASWSSAAPFDTNGAYTLCVLVESAVLLDAPELVATAHERLDKLLQQGMLLAPGATFCVPRVLALSSALRGEHAAAEALFTTAEEATARAGSKLELARSQLDHAAQLLKHAPSERERAGELAAQAHTLFDELGLSRASERARLVAAQCGVAIAASLDTAFGQALDAYETLLLRRIAQGRSYSDIAREVLISEERVRHTADRLFDKIGVEGPGLATAYAFAHGIVGADSIAPPGPTLLMVTDMVDFTGLVQRMGDLHARSVVHVHNRAIREQLAKHHGKEVTHTGDGVMAAFRSAKDATACAIAIQEQLTAYTEQHSDAPIRVRIGLNAGYVLPEEDRLFGAALIAAVRICSHARAGQILLSESAVAMLDPASRDRTRALGRYPLKGFPDQVQIYELRFTPT